MTGRFALFLPLTIAACAHQPAPAGIDVPGFWFGLWHGLACLFMFIAPLFLDGVRIDSFPNAGIWYDFGCILESGCYSSMVNTVVSQART